MEFRLVVRQPQKVTERTCLEIDGKYWTVTEPFDFEDDAVQVPEYACVSYVWGSSRLPNPVHTQIQMSTHTVPALEAAIRHTGASCEAFWIDAFCVPTERTHKAATLSSMGFIYGRSTEVVVALTRESFDAFQAIASWDVRGSLDPPTDLLDRLERDMWIRSVWTYQEVINGPRVTFVGEDSVSGQVSGTDFLNHLGYFISEFKKRRGVSSFTFRSMYPALDAFEDLLADWQVAGYLERSAYQVMACLQRREWMENANYFYSMIGTITEQPSRRAKHPTLTTLADAFMTVCESKGDYSFIFCRNERDVRPGLMWRPAPEILYVVVPWHVFGDVQPGERNAQGVLTLKKMIRLVPSTSISSKSRDLLTRFVTTEHSKGQLSPTADESQLYQIMYDRLQDMGFNGVYAPVVTEEGIFYPQYQIPSGPTIAVEYWTSSVIKMTCGSPGLAVAKDLGTLKNSYIPGFFAGDSKQRDSSLVIDDSISQPFRL